MTGRLAKSTSLRADGIYLGVKGTSGEIIVGTKEGVWKTRTMRRRPMEERWSPANMDMIVGVPWRKNDDDEKGGEEMKGGIIKLDEGVMEEAEKKATREVADIVPPKAFHTKKEDYDKHGYTRGRVGCRALLTGTTKQKLSAGCRLRMEKEMFDLERVKAARRRREEFMEKVMSAEAADNKAKEVEPKSEGADKIDLEAEFAKVFGENAGDVVEKLQVDGGM